MPCHNILGDLICLQEFRTRVGRVQARVRSLTRNPTDGRSPVPNGCCSPHVLDAKLFQHHFISSMPCGTKSLSPLHIAGAFQELLITLAKSSTVKISLTFGLDLRSSLWREARRFHESAYGVIWNQVIDARVREYHTCGSSRGVIFTCRVRLKRMEET